jgi:long-chain fatty acid transport protein
LSYRSTLEHDVEGSLTSNNQIISQDVGAKANIKLPDTAILSVVQKLDDRWEMLGDVSWTGWSSIKSVDIIRTTAGLAGGVPAPAGSVAQTLDPQFRDTWRVALGGNYKYSDALKLKFGVAWDQTPVPNPEHRLTALPDEDRIWLSVGAQWKPSPASALDLGLSYLFVDDPEINNDQLAQGRGLIRGEYENSIWILGAQYSMSF